MKEKIAAVILLFVIIISVWVNTVMLDQCIGELMDEIDKISIKENDAFQKFNNLYEEFKSRETYFGFTVSHDDLTSIEECFVEAVSYLENGNTDEAEIAKNRLWYYLEHLRRLSGFNIDSII